MIKVRVPATSANLGPGFDCLGMAINMYNEIHVDEIWGGLDITLSGRYIEGISTGEDNLVYQVMQRVFDSAGYTPKGLKIHMVNNIPLARGLGSSAACIVGGIVAANSILGGTLTLQQMIDMAVDMEGHPDNVLPAMVGGITVSLKAERDVLYNRFDMDEDMKLAVFIPDFEISTRHARKVLPSSVPMKDAIFNISRAVFLVSALRAGDMKNLHIATQDALHQPYRKKLIPHWDDIIEGCYHFGAKGVFLSGAGPTIIAVLDGEIDRFKDALYGLTSVFDEKWEIEILSPCNQGVQVINM